MNVKVPVPRASMYAMVQVPQSHGLQPGFILVFKRMDLRNTKNTYMVGCIVSLIFLYASKGADSTVCIIKETKKAAGFHQRVTAWGRMLE